MRTRSLLSGAKRSSGATLAKIPVHPSCTPTRHWNRRRPDPHRRENELFAGLSYSGASRDRTGDLLLAKQALSQLSYGPASGQFNDAAGAGIVGSGPRTP